jgi:ABC-type uncharacterized transport system auxiliary subunit
MKILLLCTASAALLLGGCISRTTNLNVTLHQDGERVLQARDSTSSKALATSAAAAQLQADLTNRFELTTPNGLHLTVNGRKDFRADTISSDVSTNTAGVVKAGGQAVGGIIEQIVKPSP